MNQQESIPMMPQSALDYYIDSISSNKLYLRATSMRSCLENIVDTVFVHLVDESEKEKWNKKTLFNKINHIQKYFPEDIQIRIHKIRSTGNQGAHQAGHKDLTDEELNITLEDLKKIGEWTILSYFEKHGFSHHAWIPTVFSLLPPLYRVRILEDLYNKTHIELSKIQAHLKELREYETRIFSNATEATNHTPTTEEKNIAAYLLLIDKLTMAYLKNGDYEKSIQFIEAQHAANLIDDIFKDQMLEKLELLWNQRDYIKISKSLNDTIEKLKQLLPAVNENERTLFITLFTAIVGGIAN